MNKLSKILMLGALLISSFAANAAAVHVDFTVKMDFGHIWGTGSFRGVDKNSNGILEYGELKEFKLGTNIENEIVILKNLYDIGDYDITEGKWKSNGLGWNGWRNNAFFTWNNRTNSVNRYWATVPTSLQTSAVPVPAAVWLFGSALLGLLGVKKRSHIVAAIAA